MNGRKKRDRNIIKNWCYVSFLLEHDRLTDDGGSSLVNMNSSFVIFFLIYITNYILKKYSKSTSIQIVISSNQEQS